MARHRTLVTYLAAYFFTISTVIRSLSSYRGQPTVLVAIGYYVVQWDATVLVKYVTIVAATFVATTILHEVLVRRINVMRFLFGMRLKKKPPAAPALEEGAHAG